MNAARPPGPPDVVCFAGQDWWYHNHAHSDFQLMRRLAERRKVLFVNSIGLRMPAPGRSSQVGRRLLRKAGSLLRLARRPDPERPDFVVWTPFLLPLYSSARARAVNARLIGAQLRIMLRLLGLHDPVYFVTLPTAWDVLDRVRPRAVAFNRSDKQSAFPEVDRAVIEDLELRALQNADAVLYVSHALMEADAPHVRGRSVFLDHGVDLELFTRCAAPADVADLAGPVMGFFGGFDDYTVDFDLLERLAVELPDATLLLVGGTTTAMDRLVRHPNVRWLGQRPYRTIPAYGSRFDVALMPWLRNDWIEHCNPIKLKEYLALGLPVVTTAYPEAARYADVVDIAEDADAFVDRVRHHLARTATEPERERRRAAVLADSWDRRAGELLAVLDDLAAPEVPGGRPCAGSPA